MKRDIWIDADHLLYKIAGTSRPDGLGGEALEEKANIKPHKKVFKEMVREYVATVEILSITEKWKPGKVRLVFSDSDGNFRKKIFPEYKGNRKNREQSPEFLALRKWAHKKYIVSEGCEADDVVAYYVRNGAVGFSTDKDLLKGVEGLWFDSYHGEWVNTLKEEADRFCMLQTLAGDSTDGIPGIPRVGLKTAENLLVSCGADWAGIVKAYKNAGLTEDDAILTRRLIGMDQWTKKEGITLWEPSK